jgi:hypothetical protein
MLCFVSIQKKIIHRLTWSWNEVVVYGDGQSTLHEHVSQALKLFHLALLIMFFGQIL